MKKLLLVIALFISMMMSSQSFIKHYDHVIKKDRVNNELSQWEPTNLIAIFSGNNKGDVVLYFGTGTVERYTKTGVIKQGISKDGFKYRYIHTFDENRIPTILQLFDSGVFRVHTQDETYEYQQPTN